jgi:hypothetical protein
MNKIVEKCIMMAPEQYMWLHRRFKTRPEGVPSRYYPSRRALGPAQRSALALKALLHCGNHFSGA